eukprot:4142964-Amphidinium_carterae.1
MQGIDAATKVVLLPDDASEKEVLLAADQFIASTLPSSEPAGQTVSRRNQWGFLKRHQPFLEYRPAKSILTLIEFM